MKALVFQHVPFESIGSMEGWLDGRGWRRDTVRFFAGDPAPSLEGYDLLLVMGGPMSVNDRAEYPWLEVEVAAVADAVARDLPTIGICLGAQLIAASQGSWVYPNAHREIGWFPLRAAAPGREGVFPLTDGLPVFHWHGETFELPVDATLLASTDGCRHQAFQLGSRVIGLQFHLETTPETAALLVEHCRGEMVPGPFVQDAADVLGAPPDAYARIHAEMDRALDFITRP